ncbi:hypothetical protein [Janthinobacterium sp. HLX7-2]|uniref:hypothetical protein n=1 Tax=Janthinobacterium sp. HLX7-2 TaxID=1259331 RepID=UPI003F1FB4ED
MPGDLARLPARQLRGLGAATVPAHGLRIDTSNSTEGLFQQLAAGCIGRRLKYY